MTRRFPDLRFAFLEGGVGWGCQLFADLIEHWERRGAKGIENMDPEKLDREAADEPGREVRLRRIAAELDERDGWPDPEEDDLTGGVDDLDDFAACKITRKEDWVDLYAKPYYFGCEADDRMNATAFGKRNPFGAQLNAIFSSDIGHFDVPDMREPLPEAYELVEDGLITDDDFRDFIFANAVRLWGTQNPRFFEGTRVAKEAAAVLAAHKPQPSPPPNKPAKTSAAPRRRCEQRLAARCSAASPIIACPSGGKAPLTEARPTPDRRMRSTRGRPRDRTWRGHGQLKNAPENRARTFRVA